jgi:hypothetical protein
MSEHISTARQGEQQRPRLRHEAKQGGQQQREEAGRSGSGGAGRSPGRNGQRLAGNRRCGPSGQATAGHDQAEGGPGPSNAAMRTWLNRDDHGKHRYLVTAPTDRPGDVHDFFKARVATNLCESRLNHLYCVVEDTLGYQKDPTRDANFQLNFLE